MFAGDAYKLLEGTADAAFVVTPEGEICFWNTAAEQLFGYSAAEVLNKTCYSILKGEDTLGTVVCMGEGSLQHCAAHGRPVPSFDLEVTTRSGHRIWVSISTIVFEDSRLHRQLIAHLARDISSRKQVEFAFLKIINLSKEVISVGDGQSELAPIGLLSEQEKRILRLFANAKNSRQVAQELGITLPTLRNHLHSVNQKLRTHNRLEAVLHAMKRHLI
jgi:PAS domain S-box-containing protein